MEKFMTAVQKVLMPIANKLNSNRYINAIRDGFAAVLPYLMAGSILTSFLTIPILKQWFGEKTMDAINAFMYPASQFSYSIIAVFVVLGIAYNLTKSYSLDPLHGALVALVSFLINCPTVITTEGNISIDEVISMGYLGPTAIFTAMLMAILSVEVYRWAIEHKMGIKLPASVPKSIQNSFTAFFPAGLTMIVALIIRQVFTFTVQGNITDFIFYWVQKPLSGLALSFPCVVLQGLLCNIFWFFGLHGQTMVGSVFDPVMLAASAENVKALGAGLPIPNIFCDTFMCVWVYFGFWISVPLLGALWLFRKKRKDWASIMKIAAIPGIFNIYEPLMFGMPLVLNPYLFIPMILTPVFTATVGYLGTISGICGMPTGIALPIVTPVFFAGVLGTNSIMAGVIQLLMMVPLTAMWYFFLTIQDRAERQSGIYVEEDEDAEE